MEKIGQAAGRLATLSTSRAVAVPVKPFRSADQLPATFSRIVDGILPDRVVMFWRTSGEAGPSGPTLRRALTANEVNQIQIRLHELRCALEPLDNTIRDETLGKLVDAMLNGFEQTRRLGDDEALVTRIGLLNVTRECPPWAIAQAIELIRTGQAGLNPNYPPNEAQLRQTVDSLTAPFADRLARVREMLEAPVEEPAPEKLTRKQIEAKLGRPIGNHRNPIPPGAYSEAERAEIERAHKEAQRQAIADLAADDGGDNDGSRKGNRGTKTRKRTVRNSKRLRLPKKRRK